MTRPTPATGRSLALGAGAEFDRIREIIRVVGPEATGLGDDCALIPSADGFMALSTDVSVEQIHFRLDWIRPAEVGWRATAAALSDLAADGAQAVGVLSAVTLPGTAPDTELLEMMAGVRDAATFVGASVLGGDLSSGPLWTLAITVVGWTRNPVTRRGAAPGDRLWVTGRLGGSRAALEAWRSGEQPAAGAREQYAHPLPRIAEGRWLARNGAHAMIDLSDGLAGDAGHLAAASEVALEIELGDIPVAPEAVSQASRLGVPPERFAAEGGEDYELLVALPPGFEAEAAFSVESGVPLTCIGQVRAGNGVQFRLAGQPIELRGFNHFG